MQKDKLNKHTNKADITDDNNDGNDDGDNNNDDDSDIMDSSNGEMKVTHPDHTAHISHTVKQAIHNHPTVVPSAQTPPPDTHTLPSWQNSRVQTNTRAAQSYTFLHESRVDLCKS